jgi:hypothetical protein
MSSIRQRFDQHPQAESQFPHACYIPYVLLYYIEIKVSGEDKDCLSPDNTVGIVACDPLLSNDGEISNYTTAAAK